MNMRMNLEIPNNKLTSHFNYRNATYLSLLRKHEGGLFPFIINISHILNNPKAFYKLEVIYILHGGITSPTSDIEQPQI